MLPLIPSAVRNPRFHMRLHSCKKHLFFRNIHPSALLSVCISAAPAGRFSVYMSLVTFIKMCRETPNFVKFGQKFRPIEMKIQVSFIVAGGINLLAPEFFKNFLAHPVCKM
jgi:hypothetical protein